MCKPEAGMRVYSERLHLVGVLRPCPNVEGCLILEATLCQHHHADTIRVHTGSGGLTDDGVVTGWRPVSELPCFVDVYKELKPATALVFDGDGDRPVERHKFCGISKDGDEAYIGQGGVKREHWDKLRVLPWTVDDESWATEVGRTFGAATRIGYREGSSLTPIYRWCMLPLAPLRDWAAEISSLLKDRICECSCGASFGADSATVLTFCKSYVGDEPFFMLQCPECKSEVKLTITAEEEGS